MLVSALARRKTTWTVFTIPPSERKPSLRMRMAPTVRPTDEAPSIPKPKAGPDSAGYSRSRGFENLVKVSAVLAAHRERDLMRRAGCGAVCSRDYGILAAIHTVTVRGRQFAVFARLSARLSDPSGIDVGLITRFEPRNSGVRSVGSRMCQKIQFPD
jgi:hypothetical protein